MPRNSPIRRLRDGVAKRLWSGDVVDDPRGTTGSADTYRRGQNDWSRTEVAVAKADDGLRRGTVPEHIESPIKGRPRSYNPLSLRQLAESGVVQSNMAAILGDLENVPWSVVPADGETNVSSGVIDEAEQALRDPNPNPESFDDINAMLARDLLEVGNCVAVTNLQVEGRRAEVVPLDPNTFTADWDTHRILQGFYQYPVPSSAGAIPSNSIVPSCCGGSSSPPRLARGSTATRRSRWCLSSSTSWEGWSTRRSASSRRGCPPG